MTEPIEFQMLPADVIRESPTNTRQHFAEEPMRRLAENIAKVGVLVPLLARPLDGGLFEIVDGARRYRAAKLTGLSILPVRVREMSDEEALEAQVIANLQREDIHPLEEAEGYARLMRLSGLEVESIAAKVGRSASYIYQRLKLLDLIAEAQKAFLAGEITAGHAVLIARLQPKDQKEALEACFDTQYGGGKQHRVLVGVRSLALWIESEIHLDLGKVPFDTGDAALLSKAGPCTTCPKRTGFSPELFPDIKHKETCTDRQCFHAKMQAHVERKKAELKEQGEKLVELSTEWRPDKKGGPALSSDKWKAAPASGKNTCESVVKGIMVDGRELGKVITVCTDEKCKKHRYGYGGSSGYTAPKVSAAEQKKRRLENLKQRRAAETRRRSFAALHAGAPAKLQRNDLDRIFAAMLQWMEHDVSKTFAATFGIEPTKTSWGGKNYDGAIAAWARKLSDVDLVRLLAVLPVIRELHGWSNPEGVSFKTVAKEWDVDLGEVEKAVTADFREKEQRIRAAAKKPAKRAKDKAKKTSKSKPANGAAQPKTGKKGKAKTKAAAKLQTSAKAKSAEAHA